MKCSYCRSELIKVWGTTTNQRLSIAGCEKHADLVDGDMAETVGPYGEYWLWTPDILFAGKFDFGLAVHYGPQFKNIHEYAGQVDRLMQRIMLITNENYQLRGQIDELEQAVAAYLKQQNSAPGSATGEPSEPSR